MAFYEIHTHYTVNNPENDGLVIQYIINYIL